MLCTCRYCWSLPRHRYVPTSIFFKLCRFLRKSLVIDVPTSFLCCIQVKNKNCAEIFNYLLFFLQICSIAISILPCPKSEIAGMQIK